MKTVFAYMLMTILSTSVFAQIKVIFDTDIGSDCDDAGAMAILHKLADKDEVEILGVVYSSGKNKYGIGVCDAINTYYGRGDLPLGQNHKDDVGDPRDFFSKQIATDTEKFHHDVIDSATDLVSAYKMMLESEQDAGVTIITVGHPIGLVHLLRDDEGIRLVRRKVSRWVAMGGGGWNFSQNGIAEYIPELLKKYPCPLYLSSYGKSVITGNIKLPLTPENNPVHKAYESFIWNCLEKGRPSWDQIAVLFAVRPQYFNIESHGSVEQLEDKSVRWNDQNNNPKHYYVLPKISDTEMRDIIEDLMSEQPVSNVRTESSKYLDAVREFADNVLQYGRDTYGPKHTPLFVDGLNIHTHEPVKWVDQDGTERILSNFSSQQNLLRTLDGLTKITGDPKYKQAVIEAVKYTFENLRSPNGLLYWGATTAHDAKRDESFGLNNHVFKGFLPYYELMWHVNPEATKELIESLWASHILNWSNLEMDRIAPLDQLIVSKGWEHEYKGGPVFFKSSKRPFATTGSDLYYSAAILSKLSGKKEPLIWAKRLIYRYVETRDPNVGISSYVYALHKNQPEHSLADDFKGHIVNSMTLFPPGIEQILDPRVRKCKLGYFIVSPGIPCGSYPNPWICSLLIGDLLGGEGKEFTQWALEELTARGKAAYRKIDNVWIPMLLDGTSLEGYAYKKDGTFGPKGTVFKPISAEPIDLWAYALAYRITGDEFMWDMTRFIAKGNGLGDIGTTPKDKPKIQIPSDHYDPYTLMALLELYRKTGVTAFLESAQKVGDNILALRFHKGFFVPSSKHIYTKFDAIEALVLLHLDATIHQKGLFVPQVWPGRPLFNLSFRDKEMVVDNALIYTLTETSMPPRSLQEAAACGDIEEVKSLISQGADVNGIESLLLFTPLYNAVINGRTEVVEFLLKKGAQVSTKDAFPGGIALHYAAEKGYKQIVELLLAGGSDVNEKRMYPAGDTPLHSAVRAGHKDIVEILIAKGADVNAKNDQGQTPLDIAQKQNRRDMIELFLAKGTTISSIQVAAQMGDLASVKALLENGADVNAQDDKGLTPLHYAVRESHKEVAELLIANDGNVNGKDKYGYPPLYYAIWSGNKDIVRLLIAKGSDVNLRPDKDYTVLYYAIWMEDLDIVKLLVEKGAEFDVKVLDDWTAFRYAVWQGSKDMVEFFISKGADASSFHMAAFMGDISGVKELIEQGTKVDDKDEVGWTALFWAACTGQTEVAEFLIDCGADISTTDGRDRNTLHQAVSANATRLTELLISKGADINVKDKRGNTSLHSTSNREVAELLIAKGADVNVKNSSGQTSLHMACGRGNTKVAELLIDKGADIDAKGRSDQTALHFAAMMGRKVMAALLIAKGADLNSKDVSGQTPLHLSVGQGHKDTAELLINKGADVNAKNKWNRTPLDIAVDRGHTEIVELLRRQSVNDLVKSGNVNVKDKDGRTPLHHAAVNGLNELVKELIVNNADVDAKDTYSQTPLHCAVVMGHKGVVELLLTNGASVDTIDNAGRTPLHYAAGASRGSANPQAWTTDIVKLVIDNGANINAKDNWGWTPLHYAAFILNKAIVNLLINRGADLNAVDNRGYTAYSCIRAKGSYYESISAYAKTRIDEWREFIKKYYDIAELIRKNRGLYFVATNGKDTNIGTLEYPLRTITAAVNIVKPGDTVFVRGGSYSCPSTIVIDKSGEPGNPIFLRAYLGENPILDFSGTKGDSIFITGAYWHLQGLTITKGFRGAIGIYGNGAHHNIFEQITAFDNRYVGIRIEAGAANNIILNSDSYKNFDMDVNGDDSDGFGAFWDIGGGNVFIGNRAWNNSDDGYDLWHAGNSVRIEKCYAWRNGENIWNHPFFSGNPNGFKLGGGRGRHVLISCLAWGHNLAGFNLNNNTDGVILRNCSAWNNDLNYAFNWSNFSEKARENCIFTNNISYNGNRRDGIYSKSDSQYNSWDADLGLVLTGDDFLSLDDSVMTQPRNPDGSIPQNDFLKLAPTSAAIDKGTDVGIPFAGQRPDLGAFEHDPNAPSQAYVKMLHQYVRDHDIAKIKELLTQGERINNKDWLGYTPLQWAVYFGYPDAVELLLSRGADPNIQSDTGRYALEIARAMAYPELEALLLKHGAKEQARKSQRMTGKTTKNRSFERVTLQHKNDPIFARKTTKTGIQLYNPLVALIADVIIMEI